MNEKISRTKGEVADLPKFRLPLNLQLFAGEDDEPAAVETTDDVGTSEQEDDNFEPVDVRGKQEDEIEVDEVETKPDPKTIEKEKQDKTTNDAFQKMRQEKEAAEKRAADVETKRQRDIEVARKFGKDYNIYSDEDVAKQYGASHGLTTVEQFEQALEKEKYTKAGLPPELVDELMESRKDRQDRQQRDQAEAKVKQEKMLVESFSELQAAYPDLVKSPSDISQEVWAIFNSGSNPAMTLKKAFMAENFDLITSKTRASEKQRTLNQINSKKHLSTEADGGAEPSDDVSIDADTLDMYKGMGMNKAQATKFHKKLYG